MKFGEGVRTAVRLEPDALLESCPNTTSRGLV